MVEDGGEGRRAPVFIPMLVPQHVENIDEDEDADNPLLVTEYVWDIYNYMMDMERRMQPPLYMTPGQQPDINASMRVVLVDWLVEVHRRFELLPETLYLSVHVLDAFLARKKVTRNRLQLTGVTAMMIASKYEEMYPPEFSDFVRVSDNVFTLGDMVKTEIAMLEALQFNLSFPVSIHFLRRYSRAGQSCPLMHSISKYLMELTLNSYDMLAFLPSQIAASALLLARLIMKHPEPWNSTLQHYSSYSMSSLLEPVTKMSQLLAQVRLGKNKAVYQKYSSSKYMRVSVLPDVESFDGIPAIIV